MRIADLDDSDSEDAKNGGYGGFKKETQASHNKNNDIKISGENILALTTVKKKII